LDHDVIDPVKSIVISNDDAGVAEAWVRVSSSNLYVE